MKSKMVIFVAGVLVGFAGVKLSRVDSAHAQISSPAYTCQFGNGGAYGVYPCAQYIVEVAPARLGGGIFIYQVEDSPFDVSGSNIYAIANGSFSGGASTQVFQPNSSVNTITISASAP